MLSSSFNQRPSEFAQYTPNMSSQQDLYAHQPSPMSGLDVLAQGSQYALEQLHEQNTQQARPMANYNGQRHGSYADTVEDGQGRAQEETGAGARTGRSNSGAVRRRISRACDQCNQLRTKCDGQTPCAHCVEFGLLCEYVRERKKRGKASRKDLAAQQAAVDGVTSSPRSLLDASSEDRNALESTAAHGTGVKRRRSSSQVPRQGPTVTANVKDTPRLQQQPNTSRTAHFDSQERDFTNRHRVRTFKDSPIPGLAASVPMPHMPNGTTADTRLPMAMGDFASIDNYHRSILQNSASANGHNLLHGGATSLPHTTMQTSTMSPYGDNPFPVPSPQSQNGPLGAFRMGGSPLSAGFLSNSGSPNWLSLPSPSGGLYSNMQQSISTQTLRYPVLRPILSRISAIIPVSLACDLLDLHFSSSSSAFLQPASPYLLGSIFRKRSVLRQSNPRPCSPGLLASMLWVGAQTCESPFLTSPPSQRGKICHQLLELTISLLKPLIHAAAEGPAGYGTSTMNNGVALGGFGMANPGTQHDSEGGSAGASGAVDDVATYMNLATVVSASEYKAASLRWWNAAWSLARELKLGRELPPNPEPAMGDDQPSEDATVENGADLQTGLRQRHGLLGSDGARHPNMPQPGTVSEEEREERRRIWWLLYTVDRHLALCYNRPLFLLDVECDGLLQPESDATWQANEYYTPEQSDNAFRRCGPSFECTGHSIFGYFLPLMTILGEIVDLSHARNHPRFGMSFQAGGAWDSQAHEISQQLEAYGRSLKDFEARFTPPQPQQQQQDANARGAGLGTNGHDANSPSAQSTSTTTGARMTEALLQTKIVVAYGTHLMHTLHIALNGRWDPISLLDDNDLWISSQSFVSATAHAVSAAEAIGDILEYDPDLSFMPFFFGIYLLQGSFLLLLIADKLRGEASPSVVKACETIVRAHEVCVVTLNTEYQRNFRKVMRSALAQVRGRMLEDFGEQQQRRREVLALYRWTGDGTGLAL